MTMDPSGIPLPPMLPGYQILEWIGEGGMGEVYLARQLSLDRIVAVKLLAIDPGATVDEQARRIAREGTLMARITHPHIVSVFDHGEFDGRPFLVMEYVKGHDLRHFMTAGQPLELDRVRSLVRPLTEALACLHDHDVLHRDFKPENILIGDGFSPKVTDFGIAVEHVGNSLLTTSERWMGTIGYVAPEVQYRLKVDARADQYSMAAVMYELLTGQKALGVLKPPSQCNKAIDERVDAIILKGLKEDRDERYATIREFGDALEGALGARPKPPRRVSARRLAKWAAILVAVFFLLVILDNIGKPRVQENSIGMKLAPIPPGEFFMGASRDDPLARPDEMPRHLVRFTRPFFMGVHEVTVGEFRDFVDATHYRTVAERSGEGGHVFDPSSYLVHNASNFLWITPTGSKPAADDEPVTQVTYQDAVAFCEWLTEKENRPYRLPTEAEWEYACRAGTYTPWFSGRDLKVLDEFAWTHRNSKVTRPVGGGHPNAFGLYDMHGNVWEWCQDSFHPYTSDEVTDPVAIRAGTDRVLRGGSWDWPEVACTRSAARLDAPPDYANFTYGFRVVLENREMP